MSARSGPPSGKSLEKSSDSGSRETAAAASGGDTKFPSPFVFADGEACANLKELAGACLRQWAVARDLLAQGLLAAFFQGIGRGDLADLARQAAKSADLDRGLCQLLERFPADAVQRPKVSVEPAQVRLGRLTPGTDSSFDLVISKQGLLPLRAMVQSGCDWLAIGASAAQSQSIFQASGEVCLQIRVLGSKLCAADKPLTAELRIATNGGELKVPVSAEVPVQPFPGGILAGALSPRELAFKAKANPQAAAALIEKGAVHDWFKSNGWDYPVNEPAASGLAAVQQLLNALKPTSLPSQSQEKAPPAQPSKPGGMKPASTPSMEIKPADNPVAPERKAPAKPSVASTQKMSPVSKKSPSSTDVALPAVKDDDASSAADDPPETAVQTILRYWNGIPKPILFGFYGAMGALFSVLFIGELLWWLARPEVAKGPPLQMAASPAVTMYYGGSNKVGIKIVRDGFKGQVVIKAVKGSDQPDLIRVSDLVIPENKDEGDIILSADPPSEGKPPSRQLDVMLVATAAELSKPSELARVQINLEPMPASVSVAASPDVALYEGGKNRLVVKLARQSFQGPVRIEAKNVPAGITVDSTVVPADSTEGVLTVTATPGAAIAKRHSIRIVGEPEEKKAVAGETATSIVVNPLPPYLSLAASAKVSSYLSSKNKFEVKLLRKSVDGPVLVEAEGLPSGVKIEPIVIPAGGTSAEMEISVGDSIPGGAGAREHGIKLKATAQTERGVNAQTNIALQVLPLPPALNIAMPPEVGVLQGGRGKFTVRVARRGLDDKPLRVTFAGGPDLTSFPDAIIPIGKNEVNVEMGADFMTPVGKKKMSATVMPTFGPNVRAETPFDLDVRPFKGKVTIPRVDIFFVLDVTGSMGFAITGVKNGISTFVKQLKDAKVDARIGILAFRDLVTDKNKFTPAMQLVMFGPSPFTTDPTIFSREVAKLRADGGGDEPESSMEAMQLASNQPYRTGVTRIMILITDASPKNIASSGGILPPLDTMIKHPLMIATKAAIVKNKIDQVHVVCNQRHLPVYGLLQEKAKGKYFDLQKGQARFDELMPTISKEIVNTIETKAPDVPAASTEPPPPPPAAAITSIPTVPAPVPPAAVLPSPPDVKEVAPPTVNSKVEPPSSERPTLQAVASTQQFAEEDHWRVVIAMALWTAAMAGGICFSLVAGHRLYIRRSLVGIADFSLSWGGGIFAGLIGGTLGEFFFGLTSAYPVLSMLTRIPAWCLLGAILGVGMGFIVPNLKIHRALLGGAIGGILGAFGFVIISLSVKYTFGRFLGNEIGDLMGRVLGATLVGFFIGVMLAFAELAFRRAWLEVAFGKLEVRTVSLGSTPVLIGADSRNATIFVESDPPITLAYRLDGDRVLCEDATTGKPAELRPGDQRKIGKVTITLRSTESARRVGITLKLSNDKSIQLTEGLPLTEEEVPGLKPRGKDGIVILVGAHPRDPNKLLLRNRSEQTWTVTDPDGKEQQVSPGGSAELVSGLEIQFGEVSGTLVVEDNKK